MCLLSSTVIFVHYTKFLEEKGEFDFADEVNGMTSSMVAVGDKIKKTITQDLPIRFGLDEYEVVLYVIHFVACMLITDEGETWYKNNYFPVWGIGDVTKITADETMKNYLRFADNFVNRKTGSKEFDAVQDKIRLRMNELFPLDET